jgi:ATP-dependent DNA helicase RecG
MSRSLSKGCRSAPPPHILRHARAGGYPETNRLRTHMKKITELANLIEEGESQILEFKTSFERETIETLVAFANTQGGRVLVGVTDNGQTIGVSIGKETLNQWLGLVKSVTSPALLPDIDVFETDGKTVVAFSIDEYPVKPVNTRGRYFKRVASSNHQLGLGEINDMYMKSIQLSWDAHPASNETLDALSVVKIESFIDKVNQSGRFSLDPSPLAALEKLKYIRNGCPTLAALLLFAEIPLRHHIHIGRFKTPSLIIDDRQITDSLFEAVEQAMKFLVSYISVAFHFDGSLERTERFSYPLPALR